MQFLHAIQPSHPLSPPSLFTLSLSQHHSPHRLDHILHIILYFVFFPFNNIFWLGVPLGGTRHVGGLLGVLVIEGLLGLHRTVQLQLLQRYWLGHRLGLLWY